MRKGFRPKLRSQDLRIDRNRTKFPRSIDFVAHPYSLKDDGSNRIHDVAAAARRGGGGGGGGGSGYAHFVQPIKYRHSMLKSPLSSLIRFTIKSLEHRNRADFPFTDCGFYHMQCCLIRTLLLLHLSKTLRSIINIGFPSNDTRRYNFIKQKSSFKSPSLSRLTSNVTSPFLTHPS